MTWTITALVVSSFVVIPVVVLGVGTHGWGSSFVVSPRAFGIVAMMPGVLLGLASRLVMIGSGWQTGGVFGRTRSRDRIPPSTVRLERTVGDVDRIVGDVAGVRPLSGAISALLDGRRVTAPMNHRNRPD